MKYINHTTENNFKQAVLGMTVGLCVSWLAFGTNAYAHTGTASSSLKVTQQRILQPARKISAGNLDAAVREILKDRLNGKQQLNRTGPAKNTNWKIS